MTQSTSTSTSTSSPIDLSIIIVTWNVWPLLSACLASIEELSRPADADVLPDENGSGPHWRYLGPPTKLDSPAALRLEVIVVDSGGTDETATLLPQRFPWVNYEQSETNLGFTAGNNWGYRLSRGRVVFFLNPDTEFLTQDIGVTETDNPLVRLLQKLDEEPTVGMVGPELRYGDGSWQSSRRHFPTRWTGFFESTWLGQLWAENPWTTHMHMAQVPRDRDHEVDWLNGSAMCCQRQALEQIRSDPRGVVGGPFDERFFMYSEELDLCQRLREAGWRILYTPDVVVRHYEGRSSEQVVVQRHIRFNTSKVRYYQKYYGKGWARLLQTFLCLEYLVQIGMESVKWGLGHKRELRWSRIQGYWAILRNGFPLWE